MKLIGSFKAQPSSNIFLLKTSKKAISGMNYEVKTPLNFKPLQKDVIHLLITKRTQR